MELPSSLARLVEGLVDEVYVLLPILLPCEYVDCSAGKRENRTLLLL